MRITGLGFKYGLTGRVLFRFPHCCLFTGSGQVPCYMYRQDHRQVGRIKDCIFAHTIHKFIQLVPVL